MTYATEVLADSPIRYWTLDDTSGTTAVDTMAAGNGTYVGAPSLAQAPLITAGTSITTAATKYATLPIPTLLGGTFSWEVWFTYVSGDIVFRDATSAGGSGTFIDLSPTNPRVRILGGSLHTMSGLTSASLKTGRHQLVITKAGTTVRFYVDGAQVDTWTETSSVSLVTPWHLGRNGTNATDWQPNKYDEASFYTTALSAARVLAHYNAGILTAPGVPTSVSGSASGTTVTITWSAPSSGGTVASYDVRLDGGSPVTSTSPKSFTGQSVGAHTLEVRAVNGAGVSSWVSVSATVLAPPGVPTNPAATVMGDSITLTWDPPVTGGVVASYEVRIDGGAPLTATDPHTFLGLAGGSHTVEVRAVNLSGSSAYVGDSGTVVPTPVGYYRVELELAGTYSWDVARWETAEYGIRLPLTLGWDLPDGVESFPGQADLTTMVFQVLVADAGDLDVGKGDRVAFAMYVSDSPTADPWHTFDGVMTQVDGSPVARADGGTDWLVTIYAADPSSVLADLWVGYTDDWPVESIGDRLERICDEAGLTLDLVLLGTGLEGWQRPRSKAPVTVLAALRDALKDAADKDTSSPPDTWYGRYVFSYDIDDATVTIRSFQRRVFPGTTTTLDGDRVFVASTWSKRPAAVQASWVIVDDAVFGTPSGLPYVRSTNLYDYTGDPPGSDTNYSAATRDNLGNALLPDGSTQLGGWAARTLRYDAAREPDPVGPIPALTTLGWASWAPLFMVIPVVITPLRPELELNGEDYIAGTLTGARMTIPPGGDFYVDFRLRPELLPGTDLP